MSRDRLGERCAIEIHIEFGVSWFSSVSATLNGDDDMDMQGAFGFDVRRIIRDGFVERKKHRSIDHVFHLHA